MFFWNASAVESTRTQKQYAGHCGDKYVEGAEVSILFKKAFLARHPISITYLPLHSHSCSHIIILLVGVDRHFYTADNLRLKRDDLDGTHGNRIIIAVSFEVKALTSLISWGSRRLTIVTIRHRLSNSLVTSYHFACNARLYRQTVRLPAQTLTALYARSSGKVIWPDGYPASRSMGHPSFLNTGMNFFRCFRLMYVALKSKTPSLVIAVLLQPTRLTHSEASLELDRQRGVPNEPQWAFWEMYVDRVRKRLAKLLRSLGV